MAKVSTITASTVNFEFPYVVWIACQRWSVRESPRDGIHKHMGGVGDCTSFETNIFHPKRWHGYFETMKDLLPEGAENPHTPSVMSLYDDFAKPCVPSTLVLIFQLLS
jgi:hypothetical protein